MISASPAADTKRNILRAFAANCMRLYKVSLVLESSRSQLRTEASKEVEGPHERFMGDDAAILAAMAFVHMWMLSDDNALVRCAYVLETVLLRSKHNYDAILLAIRVYMHLGLYARAADLFRGLDTKHIQTLSTAWILVTRISSLHPHQSKLWGGGPVPMLQEEVKWIKSSQRSLRRALNETLRHGSYRNFLRTVETFELNHQSIPALTIAAELDRASWSHGGASGTVLPSIDLGKWTEVPCSHSLTSSAGALNNDHDPRELGSFTSYEASGLPNLETVLRSGPLPQVSPSSSSEKASN